jgi:putative bacteriocin transport accessory protein
MKKILTCLLAVVLLAGCFNKTESKKNTSSDTLTITNKVSLTSTKADMKGYKWIRNDVADFQLITLKESLRMFEEGGTGILYYGYDECAWCNRAVPELNEVAKELNLTIYYVDASAKVEKDDYKKLLEYIDPVLKVNSSGEKGFYVPAVIGVKNGKLVDYHVSLLDSFELSKDDPNKQLSDAQKQELQDIYRKIAKEVAD